jgi:hypothetical protein
VVASSAAAILAGLSASSRAADGARQAFPPGLPPDVQERMEKTREFSERMRNAGSPEERTQIMEERNAWERTRAVEDIKKQLEVADTEWAVIRPRVEAVYNLSHPQPQFGGPGNMRPMSPVDRSRNELRQILVNKDAPADQIKAKLTALRTAQLNATQELAKARQNLRQIMTLRQEATLVLNGLLD